MPHDAYGHRVVNWVRGWCRRRISRRLPRRGEVMLRLLMPSRWYLLQWLPREGWWLLSSGTAGAPYERPDYVAPRYQGEAMKRRTAAEPGQVVVPALPSTSVHLPKLPALREFLTATTYDDASPRTPGYFTIRNRVTTFEVTVYDPDSGSRLSCRGPKLDDALSLIEQLLGVAEAPWETDAWLTEQLLRKRKRKK